MKNFRAFLFFLVIGITMNTINSSCTKDPEIITEIITVTDTDTLIVTEVDTVFTTVTDTLFTTITDTLVLTELMNDTATTFILVRHSEKDDVGTDPGLNIEGQARADELRRILNNVNLTAVLSTDFNRTKETAQPTADDQGLDIEIYNPSNLSGFVDDALLAYKSTKILVVGHSNTTPDILNILVGENIYADISESEYDNLYIVTVFEKGRSEVIHMKFGD